MTLIHNPDTRAFVPYSPSRSMLAWLEELNKNNPLSMAWVIHIVRNNPTAHDYRVQD